MFPGTDETRGLEEWNVNTIAHLEPEKPESLSDLWGGEAGANRPLNIFFFTFCVVIQ